MAENHLAGIDLNDILWPFDNLDDDNDQIQEFIDGQRKLNTVKMTNSHIQRLQYWLLETRFSFFLHIWHSDVGWSIDAY